MARNANSVVTKRRHKKVLGRAKGFYGARSIQYKTAKEAVYHALAYSTAHRKQRIRKMRELWIIRINAASREDGLSYNKLISGLKKANVNLDRKVLAHIAVEDSNAFKKLISLAKDTLLSENKLN